MTEKKATKNLIRAKEIKEAEATFNHPFNPKSEIIGTRLGALAGLKRTGVSIVRVPPEKEAYIYHSHMFEEEWVYILSGEGVVEIDGQEAKVGEGDFMAYPTPSVAHHLRNNGSTDLVFMQGGESKDVEFADFPKIGKRMLRYGTKIDVVDLDAVMPFGHTKED